MTLLLAHQAMHTARSDVARAHEALTTARRDASRRVTPLLGTGWTGVAADAFADAWDDWQVGASLLEEALDAMGLHLGVVHRDLVRQDDLVHAALHDLTRRLGARLGS